jgi:hypothetical protein
VQLFDCFELNLRLYKDASNSLNIIFVEDGLIGLEVNEAGIKSFLYFDLLDDWLHGNCS